LLPPFDRSLNIQVQLEVLVETPMTRWWFGIGPFNKEIIPLFECLKLIWKAQLHCLFTGRHANDWVIVSVGALYSAMAVAYDGKTHRRM